ncbi:hypothetical protein SEA_PUREGLOBE5_120 [Arthrobacter phage Pureglobe5]|nr:hypothetical protein SEA_PUREGLOBE5_120 [Arthrobacter phage Pureglobe5]
MPIRIDPVCRNCRGPIEHQDPGDPWSAWIHSESRDMWCPLMAGGIAVAAPIIRVTPLTGQDS